jgi:hypothetical protein
VRLSYPKIGSIRDRKRLPRVHYREDCFKLAIRFRHSVIALFNSDHSWNSFARVRFRNRLVWLPLKFPRSAFDEVEWFQAWLCPKDIMWCFVVLIAERADWTPIDAKEPITLQISCLTPGSLFFGDRVSLLGFDSKSNLLLPLHCSTFPPCKQATGGTNKKCSDVLVIQQLYSSSP